MAQTRRERNNARHKLKLLKAGWRAIAKLAAERGQRREATVPDLV